MLRIPITLTSITKEYRQIHVLTLHGPKLNVDKVANVSLMTTICKKYLIYLPKETTRYKFREAVGGNTTVKLNVLLQLR